MTGFAYNSSNKNCWLDEKNQIVDLIHRCDDLGGKQSENNHPPSPPSQCPPTLVNIHFSKLANSRTKSVWFSYKNTTGYQKTMF